MYTGINWQELAGFITVLAFVYGMFRNLKKDLEKKFDKIDARFDRIDKKFDKVDEDFTEVKERLSFLEAANIYTMPIEAFRSNPRSEAAKERWRRKKAKGVEHKTK